MTDYPLTIVFGASPNPSRYSYLATQRLAAAEYPVLPLGFREGTIGTHGIVTDWPDEVEVHTITLYVGPARQPEFYDYLLGLSPKRIIFNPGTENPALIQQAKAAGIHCEIACTLVLLSTGVYFDEVELTS